MDQIKRFINLVGIKKNSFILKNVLKPDSSIINTKQLNNMKQK